MKKWFTVILAACLFLSMVNLKEEVYGADEYPAKPISFIVPLEAGADGDIILRPLCQKASTLLGKPVVIVNKPGAGSSIGYKEMHAAKPDGYTIGCGFATLLTNKMQGIMPLDFADFTIMGSFYYQSPIVVASTKTRQPFKTMESVLSAAKSNPGKISVATGSVGQALWVATMVLMQGTGVELNVIPQAGAGSFTIAQAAGGHADLAVVNLATAIPQIQAGNVRLLAVIGPKRCPAPYNNVPTMNELGYNNITYESFGIFVGPRNIPQNAANKIEKAFVTAAKDPEYQKFLTDKNCVPLPLSSAEATEYVNKKRITLRAIMEKNGLLKEK